jgi:hypothetical protein
MVRQEGERKKGEGRKEGSKESKEGRKEGRNHKGRKEP